MPTVYHITHVGNLTSIIAHGGLFSDNGRNAMNVGATEIAHAHIKARRAARIVPVGPKGTLADYVPFYFAPRSPMLNAIYHSQVSTYQGGQAPIVHLVTTTEAVAEAGLTSVFTEGAAEIAFSRFFTDPADFVNIHWDVMTATWWNDTQEHPDRKRQRQAEFLAHEFMPWELIHGIGVFNHAMKSATEAAIGNAAHQPPVFVSRSWYY